MIDVALQFGEVEETCGMLFEVEEIIGFHSDDVEIRNGVEDLVKAFWTVDRLPVLHV
jgi:hypothetical protein